MKRKTRSSLMKRHGANTLRAPKGDDCRIKIRKKYGSNRGQGSTLGMPCKNNVTELLSITSAGVCKLSKSLTKAIEAVIRIVHMGGEMRRVNPSNPSFAATTWPANMLGARNQVGNPIKKLFNRLPFKGRESTAKCGINVFVIVLGNDSLVWIQARAFEQIPFVDSFWFRFQSTSLVGQTCCHRCLG